MTIRENARPRSAGSAQGGPGHAGRVDGPDEAPGAARPGGSPQRARAAASSGRAGRLGYLDGPRHAARVRLEGGQVLARGHQLGAPPPHPPALLRAHQLHDLRARAEGNKFNLSKLTYPTRCAARGRACCPGSSLAARQARTAPGRLAGGARRSVQRPAVSLQTTFSGLPELHAAPSSRGAPGAPAAQPPATCTAASEPVQRQGGGQRAHPRQRLLARGHIHEGEPRAPRDEVARGLRHLLAHRPHHLRLDHGVPAHQAPAQPALLGEARDAGRAVAVRVCARVPA